MRPGCALRLALTIALFAPLLELPRPAIAISISPTVIREAEDFGGDGVFDTFNVAYRVYDEGGTGAGIFRLAMEFDVSSLLTPIPSIFLRLNELTEFSGNNYVVNGYTGNGLMDADFRDFYVRNPIASFTADGDPRTPTLIEATAFLQSLLSSGERYAGFMIERGAPFGGGVYRLADDNPAILSDEPPQAQVPEPSSVLLIGAAGVVVIAIRCHRGRC